MPRPRVYVTRRLPGGALDLLAQHAELTVWDGDLPPPRDELLAQARTCHGLLTLLTDRVDDELLAAAPSLVAVSNMATGFDNVDVTAANRQAVLVTRTPGVLSETVAEFTLGLMLAAARRVVEADRHVREGLWQTWGPQTFLGQDLHGATLGIVGLGGVGLEVARRAVALGMRVVYHNRTAKPWLERRYRLTRLSIDELLRQSDFLSLHARLSAETRQLIGERELRLMKPTAVLVNTARGALVDQPALCRALAEGWIAAAALDVTDPEPIAPDDPLLALDNVLITPHIASASVATRSRMAMLAAENLLSALRGEVPKHAVNRSIGRRWRAALRQRLPSP